MIREEFNCSVYDAKFSQYMTFTNFDQFNTGISAEFEPNLGLHPYATDYLKIVNLNLNYVRKNLTESRKVLFEEESYPVINVHTRA